MDWTDADIGPPQLIGFQLSRSACIRIYVVSSDDLHRVTTFILELELFELVKVVTRNQEKT